MTKNLKAFSAKMFMNIPVTFTKFKINNLETIDLIQQNWNILT